MLSADFQVTARIPLPTPSGPPSPRERGFYCGKPQLCLQFSSRYSIINKSMFDIESGMVILYGIYRKLSIEKREV